MLRRLLLPTFVFLIVIAAMPATVAQAECDFSYSNYARAVQLHNMGDDNLALMHLHCVLEGDPTYVDALYLTGTIYFNRGETRDAKYYIDRAERAAAARAEEEDLLVHLLGDDARSVIRQVDLDALALTSPDPGESGEYLRPGERYQRTYLIVIWTREGSDHAESAETDHDIIHELERLLAQDPTRVDLRCELGRLYLARGDYAAAYGKFAPLISQTLGDHCNGASWNHAPAIDAAPTAEELERALERDPTRVDLRCELGELYYGRGEYAAAYAHFSYLIRETLDNYCGNEESSAAAPSASANAVELPARVSPAEGAFEDGLRYMEEGKLYLAANIFLDALDLDPLHLDARCRLGMIYSEWANYRGAIEQFDFVLQRDPQDNCARENRTIAARDMLAILTPLVVDDYFHYARTYIRMEEWELARDAFLKGLEIDPTRYDVRCELGMLYVQLGDDRAALDQFDLALFANDMDSCARSNRYGLLQRLRDQ